MTKSNKFLSVFLALIMIISIIPMSSITVSAEDSPTSGSCGENLTWTFDETTGTLTISGTGMMDNYEYNNPPWKSYENSIKKLVINSGVTTIGNYAFYYCTSLSSITIPDSVISIGELAFYNTNYYNDDNNWENDVLYIENYLIRAKDTISGSYAIKDGTKTIADYAFAECKYLTNIRIPNSITTISNCAFYYCNRLTDITIPDSVVTIGINSFGWCGNLASITIPNSVTTISVQAFYNCSELTDITIPDSVTSIGLYAFDGCSKLMNITVDDNNQYYSSDENGVLFNKDKTTLVKFPKGNIATSYTIPNSVTTIDVLAFNHCTYLNSVTIPNSVTTIGDASFDWCFALTTVTIGNNVTEIGVSAFGSCNHLTDVYYSGTEEEWNEISIGSNNEPLLNATIHYNYHSHEYNSVVTVPTCKEQGYTTYTCECGDSYIDDYVDALGHTEEILSKVTPTCTETGLTEGTKCSVCGETLTEQFTVNATGHADNDGNGYCDECDELLDPSVECDCNCHKSGISNFFFKFALFFQKIFGTNKTCDCGIAHY